MSPTARLLKFAGCGTAFFLGGPVAASMASYAGDALNHLFSAELLNSIGDATPGEFPRAIASGFGNFIAGAAYDQMKTAAAPGSLRPVFAAALAGTLRSVREEFLPAAASEADRAYYAVHFDRWLVQLGQDDLAEWNDATIQREFDQLREASEPEALQPLLIRTLLRLGQDGLSVQMQPLDTQLERALTLLIPKHLPGHLVNALSGHEGLFRQVLLRQSGEFRTEQLRQGKKIDDIHTAFIAKPATPPVSPNLLSAESHLLQPRQGQLFGRDTEAAAIAQALAGSAGRLVYVHGAPGIGKSEVCRAALRLFLARRGAGARALAIDCKAASSEGQLAAACAIALGEPTLRAEQVPAAFRRLAAAPAEPLTSVYFDNFETVEPHAETFPLVRALGAIDHVRVLASTRSDLSSAIGDGFHIHRLDPASARDLFLHCWHRNSKAPALATSARLEAFLDRQLSNHPLSIVLTAARGAVYRSLDRLIEEWSAQGPVLAHSPEENLEASFALSFKLLTTEQAQFLLTVSLFPEGLSSAAWQDIVRLEAQAWSHRERLATLNLIETLEQPEVSILAPLRGCVLKGASSGWRGTAATPSAATALTNSIHTALNYYVRVARAADEIDDAISSAPRIRLGTELANLTALLNQVPTEAAGPFSPALTSLARSLGNTTMMYPLAGYAAINRLAALCKATGDQLGQANTLRNLGELEFRLGQNDAARQHYRDALPLYLATGSQLGQANTLLNLGQLEFRLGQNDAARANFDAALSHYEAVDEPVGLALTHARLALLDVESGNQAEACRHLRFARQFAERSGAPRSDQVDRLIAHPLRLVNWNESPRWLLHSAHVRLWAGRCCTGGR